MFVTGPVQPAGTSQLTGPLNPIGALDPTSSSPGMRALHSFNRPQLTGTIIQCSAAVFNGPGQRASVETIFVAPPRKGEVRIKVRYTAVCPYDCSLLTGESMPTVNNYPLVAGHEATGVVESVGDQVLSVQPGDHVLIFGLCRCGRCSSCELRVLSDLTNTNYCDIYPDHLNRRDILPLLDGTSRFRNSTGEQVNHFLMASGFSQYTVVPETRLVRLHPSINMSEACLIGCPIATGVGAVMNVSRVSNGSYCAVFGLGAVGLAAVHGCRLAGATRIVGIDTNESKREVAMRLGCEFFINPHNFSSTAQYNRVLMSRSRGIGYDFTFEATGDSNVVEMALEVTRRGSGVCCVLGVPAPGATFVVNAWSLLWGRRLTGCILGGYEPCDLPLHEFITHRMGLGQINEAISLLRSGSALRTVIHLHDEDAVDLLPAIQQDVNQPAMVRQEDQLQEAERQEVQQVQLHHMPSHMQPPHLQRSHVSTTQVQTTHIQTTLMQPAHMQPTLMRSLQMQQRHVHLQPSRMQPAHLQQAQLQSVPLDQVQMDPVQMQQLGIQQGHLQPTQLQQIHLSSAHIQPMQARQAQVASHNERGARPDDVAASDTQQERSTAANARVIQFSHQP